MDNLDNKFNLHLALICYRKRKFLFNYKYNWYIGLITSDPSICLFGSMRCEHWNFNAQLVLYTNTVYKAPVQGRVENDAIYKN